MKAELRTINDNTEILVNGKPVSRMLGRLSLPSEWALEKLEQYEAAGIDIFLTNTDQECSLGWDGEDEFDYEPYEHQLDRLVRRKPDILLVLYVGCSGGSPYKWNRAHEEELGLLTNGDRLRIPSFASDLWLRDSCMALARFVEHFQSSRFADNIIGYNPIQFSNEWHTPSSRGHRPLDDYSAPMLRRFRAWLEAKYGDEAALRDAWGDREVTFATAAIPTEERRLRIGADPLPFGTLDPAVYDYERRLEQARTDFIIAQCRAVKEASREPTLVMLSRYHTREMLDSPWVDCAQGPYHYVDRKIVHVSGYAKGTYRSRGKLHMDQIDTGTHLMPKTGGDPLGVGSIWPGPYRLTDSMEETLEMLERDVAFSVAENGYTYWNEGGPGWMFPVVTHGTMTYGRFWFDAPKIRDRIAVLKRVVDENRSLGAESVARVAVVCNDEHNRLELASGSPIPRLFGRVSSTMSHIARAGFAFDAFSLEDFDHIEKSYDLYVFPLAHYVPAAIREAIVEKLESDGASALWYYGAGFMGESGSGVERCEELTGIRLAVEHASATVQVEPGAGGTASHDLLRGADAVGSYGSRTASIPNNGYEPLDPAGYSPESREIVLPATFACDDPAAIVLGTIEGDGRPGFVVKELAGRRSFWTAAPELPWQIVRNIAGASGIHVYADSGDQAFANSRFVALWCISAGEKVIRLPQPGAVRDALTGEVVADTDAAVSEIRFSGWAGETRSFFVEPV